jgi:glycine cleavage system H protein
MSDGILELAVDKFLFRFPAGLFYSDAGIWAQFEGRRVRIGLSDFTQMRNGDVTFVEMKGEGTEARAGDEIGTIETIKVNLSVPSPVSGTIVELNRTLEESPEFVNQDPYDKGWLAIIEVESGEAALKGLKPAAEYFEFARAQAEAEILR